MNKTETLIVALFMGIPVGTIALGIVAGVYMGRRESHSRIEKIDPVPVLRKTACVTASLTAIAALPIGILALRGQDILNMLEDLSGLSQARLQGFTGHVLIGFLCVLLFLIQYWLSKNAGLLAFKANNRNIRHMGLSDSAARCD